MDKLSSMKAFIQVARLGSFSAAAETLGISKAMVSKHISRLEESLDIQLFNRTTRSLSLTEVGTVYRDRVREILDDIEEAELAVSQLSSEPRGTLRLMAPTSFGSFHLSRIIAAYLREYSHVNIDMILTERMPDLIEERLDLAIRIGNLEDSSLFARKITDARMIVCGSRDYLKRSGIPETPEDLQNHNCLTHTTHTGEAWTFRGSQGMYRIDVHGTVKSNAVDALRIAAIQGCGLVHLPIYMLTKDLKTGRLVSVLNDYEGEKRPIHAVYPHRMHLSAKVRTFVDFLYDQYQQNPIESERDGE